MKILALQANPEKSTVLRLAEEARQIRERLLAHAPTTDLIVAGAVRPQDLSALIHNYQPDVVHFSGHGTKGGDLVLEDGNKRGRLLSPELLREAFYQLAPAVRCVVLNSCYSSAQAASIAKVVPCVIGMRSTISDQAAISFAAGFYRGLAIGKNVRDAMDLAVYETKLSGLGAELTPELVVRRGPRPPDPRNVYVLRGPQLLAHFDPENKPKKKKRHNDEYEMVVYIRDVPSSANCCVYQYIDEDGGPIKDDVHQVDSYRKGFPSECSFFGDVIVRATLWSQNTGIGISRPLADALAEHYGKKASKKVLKALKDIRDN
jgi:hypothetical protein